MLCFSYIDVARDLALAGASHQKPCAVLMYRRRVRKVAQLSIATRGVGPPAAYV